MEPIGSVGAGSGRLLLVTGPAGAGKTWRANAIAESAREAGLTPVWAAGGRPGAPPFWPWLQVLRTVLPGTGDMPPAVKRLLAADAGSGDLRARFELFEDVVGVLRDAAARSPLLVVLDDLHDADAASLLLAQHVAAQIRSLPLVLVATVRTDVPPAAPEWPQVWAELVRRGEVLDVGPLTEAEIAGLLESHAGSADAGLVRRIARRTGGNALFVSELVRLCAASAGDVEALPGTVRAVIATRVAERSPACRRVLSLAATAGPRAPLDLVVDVLGDPVDDVLATLEEAQVQGLLDGSDSDHVAFVNEIVRDAVYDALPAAHRAHWHRAVADRLATADDAAGAAWHYRRGGPGGRPEAARWFVRAGELSLAMLAYEEAAAQFRAALECDPPDPGRVHLRLGTALLAVGDASGARTAHLAALDLARASGDTDLLVAAALGLGAGQAGFEVPLFDREQVAALEDALRLLDDGHAAARATVLARLAIATTFTADEESRVGLASEAVRLARACGDEAALAVALASYVDATAGPDHLDERLEQTSEIVDLARRLRDSSLELLGRRQRIEARLELGDIAGVAEDMRDYESVATSLRQPMYSWYVPLWSAALALARGETGQAAALLGDAEALGRKAGSGNSVMLVVTHRAMGSAELGDPAAMRAAVAEVALDESMGPWVPIARAHLHACSGEISDARATLDGAADRITALPRDSEWLPALTQAAETVQLVGGHPVAGWLYDALLPYAGQFVVEGIGAMLRGSVERHLGALAAALGDRAAAERHFSRGVEANRRIGARLLVARTLYDAATALGDADRLAEARRLYAEMGVTGRLDRAAPAPASDGNVFRRDGEMWTLAFAGHRVVMRDSKGLQDLAVLLANPGRPVPAVELAAPRPSGADRPREPVGPGVSGDLGEVLDARARGAYRQRLRDLEEEAELADADADIERSARIAEERDALVAELGAAYGLAGRPRRTGSPVERARSTVTARIRDSIRRVQSAHPELGRHLAAAVRTGTLCSYEPEHPVSWRLTP